MFLSAPTLASKLSLKVAKTFISPIAPTRSIKSKPVSGSIMEPLMLPLIPATSSPFDKTPIVDVRKG